MKLRKKIGIGLGIIGALSVAVGAGLQVYKNKKKDEDIEDISFEETSEETPSERLENLATEELDEEVESSDNKKDLIPFALFSVGAVASFGAAYFLCCGTKNSKDKIEEDEINEEIETNEIDEEVEKVGDVEKGEEKEKEKDKEEEEEEEFDFESALSKTTGRLEEMPLRDNTAELLYGCTYRPENV